MLIIQCNRKYLQFKVHEKAFLAKREDYALYVFEIHIPSAAQNRLQPSRWPICQISVSSRV